MLSLSGVVSVVEGQLGRKNESPTQTDDEDLSPADESRSTLYQCPDCESVYVALDKQTCSTCDAAVEEVPSTLSRTQ